MDAIIKTLAEFNIWSVIVRVVLAALCGGLIGSERSSRLVSRSRGSSPGATGISGWHSRRTRGDRHSSRVEAKNPALLSSRDGYLLELTGWTKGSQAS